MFGCTPAHERTTTMPLLVLQPAVDSATLGVVSDGATLFLPMCGWRAAEVRGSSAGAFTDSLSTVFLVAAAVVLVAFLLSWLIEERPLRQTVETAGLGEAFATPKSDDSLQELTRELAQLVGRERTRAF